MRTLPKIGRMPTETIKRKLKKIVAAEAHRYRKADLYA